MRKYKIQLLLLIGIVSSCSKQTPAESSKMLYTRSLDQIKKSLEGTWYVRTKCYITIAGLNCQQINNETLIFSDDDSLVWIKNNEIIRDKIIYKRIKSPDGYSYETDSIYVFRLAKENSASTLFPYDIRNDTLRMEGPHESIDAGFGMVLTRAK